MEEIADDPRDRVISILPKLISLILIGYDMARTTTMRECRRLPVSLTWEKQFSE